jgi:hypothetical protein
MTHCRSHMGGGHSLLVHVNDTLPVTWATHSLLLTDPLPSAPGNTVHQLINPVNSWLDEPLINQFTTISIVTVSICHSRSIIDINPDHHLANTNGLCKDLGYTDTYRQFCMFLLSCINNGDYCHAACR